METETLMTAAGLELLQQELQDLTVTQRPEIARRLKEARELGDLKENAEYHAAKEAQSFLETRIKVLEQQIRTARVVEAAGDVVSVGATVVVRDLDAGDLETWTITGVAEADPLEQRVSYESPLGSALVGCVVGDTVDVAVPSGSLKFEVVKISV